MMAFLEGKGCSQWTDADSGGDQWRGADSGGVEG